MGSNTPWPKELEDRLRELVADTSNRMTAAELANALGHGISRCAIVGKVRRLGLQMPYRHGITVQNKHLIERTTRKRPPKGAAPVKRLIAFGSTAVLGQIDKPMPAPKRSAAESQAMDAAIPQAQRRNIFQLTGKTCRWPVGNPGEPDFFFCAAKPEPNCPYCERHWLVSIDRHPASWLRNAAKVGEAACGGKSWAKV